MILRGAATRPGRRSWRAAPGGGGGVRRIDAPAPVGALAAARGVGDPPAPWFELEGFWGEAPFVLRGPIEAAQTWAAQGAAPEAGGLDLFSVTDPAERAAIAETALAGPIGTLEATSGVAVRFEALRRRSAVAAAEAEALFGAAAPAPEAADDRASLRLATRLGARLTLTAPQGAIDALWSGAARLDADPAGAEARIGVLFAARMGASSATVARLRGVEPGDALVVAARPDAEALAVAGEALTARVEFEEGAGAVRLIEPLRPALRPSEAEFLMAQDDNDRQPAADAEAVDELPIPVVFEAGRAELTVAELKALAVGDAIPLGGAAAPRITVYAGGRRFAAGSLIELDGQLAVEIETLARP